MHVCRVCFRLCTNAVRATNVYRKRTRGCASVFVLSCSVVTERDIEWTKKIVAESVCYLQTFRHPIGLHEPEAGPETMPRGEFDGTAIERSL
jgi:hypothetical protein